MQEVISKVEKTVIVNGMVSSFVFNSQFSILNPQFTADEEGAQRVGP